jgi:hypothetical protein
LPRSRLDCILPSNRGWIPGRNLGPYGDKRFIYYREDDMFVGWLDEYPDYRTQGEILEELEENLKDLTTSESKALGLHADPRAFGIG